jgi:hypothetical protein
VQQWVARYNGPGNEYDVATAVAVDGSGNVYVTGWSLGSGSGYDYATIKYNASGVQQWVARYNGPGTGNDYALAIAVNSSGIYVTGFSIGSGTGYDYATIKYDFTGQQQWVVRYDGPASSDDKAVAIAVDGSGNAYVTGGSAGLGQVGCINFVCNDYATIKYDASGAQKWVARYNGPGNSDDVAVSLAVDGSSNVYVTGTSDGSGRIPGYATIKYNASGTQQWVARYDGPGNAYNGAYAMAIDRSGNVYVTGQANLPAAPTDYATVKYDASGTQQWARVYNGPGNSDDIARAIAVDGSGSVYVIGYSTGSGTGYDYATIKYGASGAQLWVDRYNGPGNGSDAALATAIDASGNAYATGQSAGSSGDYDYATIKYYSCWPACTRGTKKDSFTFPKRRGISDRRPAAEPAPRIGWVAKKDRKSTDSLKNFRKRRVASN